jgi:hypothetical protein
LYYWSSVGSAVTGVDGIAVDCRTKIMSMAMLRPVSSKCVFLAADDSSSKG